MIVTLSTILNISTYELLTGEVKSNKNNIETETRVLFSLSEEDKIIAKELLDKIKIVDNNKYDFFDLFHYDTDDLMVKQALELLMKSNLS